jgi:Ca2+-binding EF-hand superfamily protein
MKSHRILAIAAVLAPLSAFAPLGAAQAQMANRLGDLFADADADHDGRISRAEFTTARNARFAKLDRNGDGVITQADFPRASAMPAMKAQLDKLIADADADRDGRVTRAEFTQAPITLFDLADSNHDGFVDQAELAAFRTRMQSQSRQR